MTSAGTLPRRHLRRGLLLVAGLAVYLLVTGAAAAQGMEHHDSTMTPQSDSVQSVIHILGIASSLALTYYGYRARQRFKGGALASAATSVIVGGLLFAAAFTVEELHHGLGIEVFGWVGDQQLHMALEMILFTGTVLAFGWAFYRITDELKDWYA